MQNYFLIEDMIELLIRWIARRIRKFRVDSGHKKILLKFEKIVWNWQIFIDS